MTPQKHSIHRTFRGVKNQSSQNCYDNIMILKSQQHHINAKKTQTVQTRLAIILNCKQCLYRLCDPIHLPMYFILSFLQLFFLLQTRLFCESVLCFVEEIKSNQIRIQHGRDFARLQIRLNILILQFKGQQKSRSVLLFFENFLQQ